MIENVKDFNKERLKLFAFGNAYLPKRCLTELWGAFRQNLASLGKVSFMSGELGFEKVQKDPFRSI